MSTTVEKTIHGAAIPALVKKLASRAFRFRASTGAVDRMKDTVAPDKWQLAGPVPLLWNHDTSIPALGVARPHVTSGALLCDVEFLPPGLNALADEMVARIEAGFPPQCSVGFLATETPTRNTAGGTAYRGQSLLELSLVNIPANADARLVPQMRAADPAPIVQWLVAKGVAPFPRAPLRLAKGEIRLGPAPTLAGTAPGEVRIGGGTSAVALAQAFPSITRLLRPPTMKSNPLDLPPGISERDVRRMVVDGVKIALAQAVRRLRADY